MLQSNVGLQINSHIELLVFLINPVCVVGLNLRQPGMNPVP